MNITQLSLTRTVSGAFVLAAVSAMAGYWVARSGSVHSSAATSSAAATQERKPLYS